MRTNLKVPFAEKDNAKKLGARWDAARKLWYVENIENMAPFAKWSPSPHDDSSGGTVAQKSAPSKKPLQVAGKLVVGSAYTETTPLCACLPWDVCSKCQSTALTYAPIQSAGAA